MDGNGSPTAAPAVFADVDEFNETLSVVVDPTAEPVNVLLNETWVRSVVPDPAFGNASYVLTSYNDSVWFEVAVVASVEPLRIEVSHFQPEFDQPVFSEGSPESIQLERAMNISIVEVPNVEFEQVALSNDNGSWFESRPVVHGRVGISFTDEDTSGQTVALNRSWLGRFGIEGAWFSYEDGTAVANTTDGSTYYVHLPHFSILYVFTNGEGFWKEDDRTYSNVYWDSVNRNIYVLSDRRDPTGTNERLRSPAPVVYDQTTSFTLRARWKTSQQGNWQAAAPVFFMGAGNSRVDMANSVYVFYSSRDSNLGWTPYYYLRYQDSTGTLRINYLVVATANTQYEFRFSYDAYTQVMSLTMLDSVGNSLGSTAYTLGTSESFSLGKVGAAAWGSSNTAEPTIIAKTDDIFLEANMARNGNYEIDSNSDGIPDNWQFWIWSKACTGCISRSSTFKKFGTWSVKILDSDTTKDYGLQTVRMSVNPGETYTGSVWVYESSGWNSFCIEFWDYASGGTRKGVVCKTASYSVQWEFMDVTMQAPSGAYYADLLVYSSSSNTGTGYFDGAELKRSRSFWSVHVHTNHLPDMTSWSLALDYVTDLGITNVRIDFVWASFEPSEGATDWGHVAYWDNVVRMARSRGIGIVAILAHVPEWAIVIRDCVPYTNPPVCGAYGSGDLDHFFQHWNGFARFIASRYGQDIQYYQLLNEENHPSNDQFPHTHDGEPRAFYQAYQGLLDGTVLTPASHKSRFKTIINAWADDLPFGNDWNAWLRDILIDSWGRDSIDVVAIDHYPGTWCCGSNYRDWAAFDTLTLIARDYAKEVAVMETGYSTYAWPDHDRGQQVDFVNNGLDELLLRRNSHNLNYPLNSVLLVSWYELIDSCTGCWVLIPQEVNFGILLSSPLWGQKEAYGSLRYQVSRWS